ncbi:hypothetical protein D3C85_1327840 [compost metagenome]
MVSPWFTAGKATLGVAYFSCAVSKRECLVQVRSPNTVILRSSLCIACRDKDSGVVIFTLASSESGNRPLTKTATALPGPPASASVERVHLAEPLRSCSILER